MQTIPPKYYSRYFTLSSMAMFISSKKFSFAGFAALRQQAQRLEKAGNAIRKHYHSQKLP
jgi:hypothetical protein